jgi:hypothetical protein
MPKTLFSNWSIDKSIDGNWNNKGLNVIFMKMSLGEFKRIYMCNITKKAWDIF